MKKTVPMTPLKSKTLRFATIILVLVAVISFLAADRYLIRHVEIASVSAYAASVVAAMPAEATAASNVLDPQVITAPVETFLDDWNYQSETVSISIRKVTSGSGSDALVYFVADIVLKDATALRSAFADNQFGRNIVEKTSVIAAENEAIFAINGDYYGFRTDGIIIRNGVIYRDDPARVGLAFYRDGSVRIYGETETSAQELLDAGVWNTLSFGPALLVNGAIPTDLASVEVDTNFGNHSIQGSHPRTGVGIISANHFVFVVVDGRSPGYSTGVTLPEFAQIFQNLGCATAYNIDGGGSSTLYFNGRVANNPLGRNRERGTSDILYIAAEE